MRIVYIANARMPTEKAHGLQIMHMCRAFSQIGHDVTLVIPKRKNWIDKTVWEFYDMEPCFKIVHVPIVDFIVWDKWLGNFALWLETLWFGKNARRVVEELAPDVIYSREPFSSAWTPRWIPHVFEAHTFPNRAFGFYRWLWNKNDRVVTVTDGLHRMFVETGVPEFRLRTAADAVDLEAFEIPDNKEDARRKLGLPLDKFLVVYAGHLYPYKGIPDLMHACQWLHPDIRVVIVGGRPQDLERTKEMGAKLGLTNVIFVGRVPHREVPIYLRTADIVTMPYTRENHHVEYYSSPLKLFEYLAAGRAILSTDLPSVREVLDDTTAEYVRAEDPEAIADGINRLHANPARVAELEGHSRRLAKNFTWKARARAVLDAMPKPRVEWKLTLYRKYRLEIHLTILAFLLRAAYVTFVPQAPLEGGDGLLYTGLADMIRGARGTEGFPLYYQPFYPHLLAAARAIFGEELIWGRLLQAAMSSATVFLMALMARRWISAYAAWAAGLLGTLYVPMILESGIYYTETTYAFLLTLLAYTCVRAMEQPRWARIAWAAGAAALAGLTRELGFYTAALIAGWAAFRKHARLSIMILAVVAASMTGLALRNREIAARANSNLPVPVVAKGYEVTVQDPVFVRNAFGLDRLHLYPLGVWHYLRFPFRLIDLSDGMAVKEALRSFDARTIAAAAPQLFAKGMLVLMHWALLTLAIYGALRGSVSKDLRAVLLIVIGFAGFSIIFGSVGRPQAFALFEPLARYRFPTEPLILVFAAAGIDRLTTRKLDAKAS